MCPNLVDVTTNMYVLEFDSFQARQKLSLQLISLKPNYIPEKLHSKRFKDKKTKQPVAFGSKAFLTGHFVYRFFRIIYSRNSSTITIKPKNIFFFL